MLKIDLCVCVCVFGQNQGVMKHGARGKRQTLKSASTDLGTTDVGKRPETRDLPI